MEQPTLPTGASAEANFARRLHDEVFSGRNRPISRTGLSVSRTTRGIILKQRIPPAAASGWRYADPKKYDTEKQYSINEITIVGPNNPAVAVGATPGQWVCVQEPTVTVTPPLVLHLPIWPPPGMTVDEALNDPDNEAIFWLPFYLLCS